LIGCFCTPTPYVLPLQIYKKRLTQMFSHLSQPLLFIFDYSYQLVVMPNCLFMFFTFMEAGRLEAS